MELIKKLESGVLVVRVCDECGVKKQTVSDIRRSNDKPTSHAMKFEIIRHKRKHMKVPKSREFEVAVYMVRAAAFSESERAWVGNR